MARVAMRFSPTLFAPPVIHGDLRHAREARCVQCAGSIERCPARPTSANIGFERAFTTAKKTADHILNFANVCANVVDFRNCDFLFGCEIGAIRSGLEDAGISLKDILSTPFGGGVCCAEVNNYMGIWNFGAAYHVSVSLHGNAEVAHIPGTQNIDAVIARFDVKWYGEDNIHVVTGTMHYLRSQGPPPIMQRKNAMRELRNYLDSLAAPDGQSPVVRIILGDDYMGAQYIREDMQNGTDDASTWIAVANTADFGGGNVAICGPVARFACIAISHSPAHRSDRHGADDAPTEEIVLHGASQPAGGNKRKRKGAMPPSSRTPALNEAYADHVMEELIRWRAQELHEQMKEFWKRCHEHHCSPQVRDHLSRVLFLKANSGQSTAEDTGIAFASEEETTRGIAAVLRSRHEFLKQKGIDDFRHVLADTERKELLQEARESYWQTPHQRKLEQRDVAATEATGDKLQKGEEGKGTDGARGASPPAGQRKPKDIERRRTFVRRQKLNRWHSHVQRLCGTEQIWEVLAFTGRFDVTWLEKALRADADDSIAPLPLRDEAAQQHRRQLHHARAEAVARFMEGERLARHRAKQRSRGASQPAGGAQGKVPLTRKQAELLHKFDNGKLEVERNRANLALGHNQLRNRDGTAMNVGGAIVGGSSRLVDNWMLPDFHLFLEGHKDRGRL